MEYSAKFVFIYHGIVLEKCIFQSELLVEVRDVLNLPHEIDC